MKFEPNDGQVLIKLFKRSSQTKSGIVIARPDKDADKDTNLAEIVSIPADQKKYKVGDVVLIRVFAGAWIDPEIMPDQEYVYRIISNDEILAKAVEPDPVVEFDVR